MTSRPTVTTTIRPKPNQPRTMADVPTPLLTLPLPISCAIVLAATDAVCCHNTETRTKTDETNMRANAAWDTGRDGNGFTSFSDPALSTSSCQPGNVARSTQQKKARIMATMLLQSACQSKRKRETHRRYGKTTASLNVDATQIKFNGS